MKENTHSLWAWLNQPAERTKYLNPLYAHNPLVIWPSVEPQSIQLWQGKPGLALPKPSLSSKQGGLRESSSAVPSLDGYGAAELTHSPFSARFVLPMDPFVPAPGRGLGRDPAVGREQQPLRQGGRGEDAEPVPLRPRCSDRERKMNSSAGDSVPMGCGAKVGSAVQDTAPVGQLKEWGRSPFCSLWAAQTELVSVKRSLSQPTPAFLLSRVQE